MSENLEKRVQELEDILAIQHLKHAYLNACDAKDVQAMIETFVISDCKIDYGPVGSFTNRDDLQKFFKRQHVMTTCLNLITLTTQLLKLSMPAMQLAIGR
jgi:hypothetical protein